MSYILVIFYIMFFFMSQNQCIMVRNSYSYAPAIVSDIHQKFPPKLVQNSPLWCSTSTGSHLSSFITRPEHIDRDRGVIFLLWTFSMKNDLRFLDIFLFHFPQHIPSRFHLQPPKNYSVMICMALLYICERSLLGIGESNSLS